MVRSRSCDRTQIDAYDCDVKFLNLYESLGLRGTSLLDRLNSEVQYPDVVFPGS